VETLETTAAEIGGEVTVLEARREPARLELETRRDAAGRSAVERDQAAATLSAEEGRHRSCQRRGETRRGERKG
jgi:hypothetical protein